jgi:hypothetical protein
MNMSTDKLYILRMDEHEVESWGERDKALLAKAKPANECVKDAPLKPEEIQCIERAHDEESRYTRETMPLYTDPVTTLRLPLVELRTRLMLRSQQCKSAVFYSVNEKQLAEKLVEQLKKHRNDGACCAHNYLSLTSSEAGWTDADCAMIDAAVKHFADCTGPLPQPAWKYRPYHDADFCRDAERKIVEKELPADMHPSAWVVLKVLAESGSSLSQDHIVKAIVALVDKHPWCKAQERKSRPDYEKRTLQMKTIPELERAGCVCRGSGNRGAFITRRGRIALKILEPTLRGDCAPNAS